MRAALAWKQLEDLVLALARQHTGARFTAVIDTFGKCSIAVNKSPENEATSAAGTAIANAPSLVPWLAEPSVLTYSDKAKDNLLKWALEETNPPRIDARVPNAFRLSRTLSNESWRQPPSSNPATWPKVVAFYSFKGGVGRSTAAAITALLMAREGRKILLVDLDLEAPGLEGYFGFNSDTLDGGMVDLLLAQAAMTPPWHFNALEHRHEVVVDPEVQNRGGLLHIVPAGLLDRSYPERLGRLALADLARTPGADNPLRVVLQGFIDQEEYDLILVDCRTGFSEIGGMALNGLSDLNVLMFKAAEAERRYVEVVLDHMARLNAELVNTAEDARRLANSLLFVFSMAQLPPEQDEATLFVSELRERVSKLLWDRVFEHVGRGLWDQPDVNDIDSPGAPVPHDVVIIPYQRDLPALTRASDMLFNAIRGGVASYDQLTRRILDVKLVMPSSQTTDDPALPAVQGDVVTALASLLAEVHAEDDLKGAQRMKERFLPRVAHRGLLSANVLVIQGAKGSGKSALFVAFQDRELLQQLALYAGVAAKQQQRLAHTDLMVGFDESMREAVSTGVQELFGTFEARPRLDVHETLRCYWRALLCARILDTHGADLLLTTYSVAPLPQLSQYPTVANAHILSLDLEVQAELVNWLKALMERAKDLSREIWVLYDGLDAHLSTDPARRGPLVSALVDLWWTLRGQPVAARIFLRDDIWDREVSLVDKGKITEGTYRARLEWDAEELYRLLIKRLLVAESFHRLLRDRGLWRDDLKPRPGLARLDIVPPTDADWLQRVVAALVGEYMGASKKKGLTYSWIIKHLGDSRERVRPRSLLLLFATAATLQGADLQGRAPLDQERLRDALRGTVSGQAVDELREEFKSEWTLNKVWVPDMFKDHETLWPVEYRALRDWLKRRLKVEVDDVDKLIQHMINSGLLERRVARTSDKLQVPDIYLYGLGLTRKG